MVDESGVVSGVSGVDDPIAINAEEVAVNATSLILSLTTFANDVPDQLASVFANQFFRAERAQREEATLMNPRWAHCHTPQTSLSVCHQVSQLVRQLNQWPDRSNHDRAIKRISKALKILS